MDKSPARLAANKDRLQEILRGAFAGPPTPLKDIPKKNGESRTERLAKKARKRHRK